MSVEERIDAQVIHKARTSLVFLRTRRSSELFLTAAPSTFVHHMLGLHYFDI